MNQGIRQLPEPKGSDSLLAPTAQVRSETFDQLGLGLTDGGDQVRQVRVSECPGPIRELRISGARLRGAGVEADEGVTTNALVAGQDLHRPAADQRANRGPQYREDPKPQGIVRLLRVVEEVAGR